MKGNSSGSQPANVCIRASQVMTATYTAAPSRTRFHSWVMSGWAAGAVASGTASLEAATAGMPMAVIYRMNRLSHWIARRMLQVDHVAMPNLIAGHRVVPELLQDQCTAETVAAVLGDLLDDTAAAAHQRDQLRDVLRALGEPGVFDRAAERVLAQLPRALTTSV